MSECKRCAQAPEKIHTYPKMNETIKDLLRGSDEPMDLYVVARLEELETQLATVQECLRSIKAALAAWEGETDETDTV